MAKWIVVLAGAAVVTGCAQQSPREIEESNPVDREAPEQIADATPRALFGEDSLINAIGGRLEGAVGPATGLDHDAQNVTFYDDGYYTMADLTVRGENGSAMGIFSLSGSVRSMEAGEGVRTCESDYGDPNSALNTGGVAASFTGCANSGEPSDGWSYDAPADCTDVTIEEPLEGAPEETVATMQVLAHWSEANWGEERTVKATIHLTER